MIIKQIELQNVQKHAKLMLSLRKGINVLWGKTGSGKTCIIRALVWILTNNFSSDAIRKDDTKKTVVKLVISEVPHIKGDIIISRVRTNSINRYEIKYPDKEELVVHDSVGKIIPEEVVDLFGLPIMKVEKEELVLNIQSQLDRHFLVIEKATFRSKVLNKLTNNDLLDKIIKSFNSDLLGLSKQERQLSSEVKDKTVEKEALETQNKIDEDIYNEINREFKNLKIEQEELNDVRELHTNLLNVQTNLKNLEIEIEDLELPNVTIIPELKVEIDKLCDLERLHNQIVEIQTLLKKLNNDSKIEIPSDTTIVNLKCDIEKLSELEELHDKLLLNKDLQEKLNKQAQIEIPKISLTMRKDIETLEILTRIAQDYTLIQNRMQSIDEKEHALKGEIEGLITKYKEIPIPTIDCPKCGTKIKEYEIKELMI